MIRTEDGAVLLSGLTITPKLTKTEFLASEMAHEAKPVVNYSRWNSFRLTGRLETGETIGVVVYFEDERLDMVGMGKSLPGDEKGWDGWSLEQEFRRKAFHDSLLSAWLGNPPYVFPWGTVGSSYDDKSGRSGITIRYTRGAGE